MHYYTARGCLGLGMYMDEAWTGVEGNMVLGLREGSSAVGGRRVVGGLEALTDHCSTATDMLGKGVDQVEPKYLVIREPKTAVILGKIEVNDVLQEWDGSSKAVGRRIIAVVQRATNRLHNCKKAINELCENHPPPKAARLLSILVGDP